MGGIHKIDDEYYIEFYARGLKYQQRAGRDLPAAQRLLREVEEKIAKGEMATMTRDVDIDIFLEDFLDYARRQYSTASHKRYQSLTEHFYGFVKRKFPQLKKLSGVTPIVIEQYKIFLSREEMRHKHHLKPRLVNFSLLLLADVLEYSRRLGYLNDNPALHIRLILLDQDHRPALPTAQEMQQLIRVAPVELAYTMEFVILTGITVEELVNLKWENVNWRENFLEIKDTRLRERSIPCTVRAVEILKVLHGNCYPQTPFVFGGEQGDKQIAGRLEERLTRAHSEAGLDKNITFRKLRRVFAYNLICQDVSLFTVNRLLGFSDVARIVFYFRFLQEKRSGVNVSPLSLY